MLLLATQDLPAIHDVGSVSAGVVDRVLEREYESRPLGPYQEAPIINMDVPKEQLDLCDGETVFVKSVSFCGNTIFSSSCLELISEEYCNRDITMGDINRICLAVQLFYADKGYFLALAFPPDQDITDGTLQIEIMEGKLGDIFVIENEFYSDKFIAGYFERFKDLPINYHQIIRAILLLNENADIFTTLIFKKGSRLGTADIVLKVEDEWPVQIYEDCNNYGTNQISKWRAGVRLDYGNLFTDGDMLSVTEVVGREARDLNFTDAIYSVPLNKRGTRLSLSYLNSFFKVRKIADLRLKGKSEITSLKVGHAITRTKNLRLDGFIAFDYKQLKNYAVGRTSSFDKLRIGRIGIYLDKPDPFYGRNIIEAYGSVGCTRFLGGSKAVDELCSRFGSGGRFNYLTLDVTRIQSLPEGCSLILNSSFQFTGNKLPNAEQIYIGGVDTVRGFPSALRLGDKGFYANFELRFPPPFIGDIKIPCLEVKWREVMQLLGFVDTGRVSYNGRFFRSKEFKKKSDVSRHSTLTGAGVGLRAIGPYGLDFSLDVGFPLNHRRHVDCVQTYFRASIHI